MNISEPLFFPPKHQKTCMSTRWLIFSQPRFCHQQHLRTPSDLKGVQESLAFWSWKNILEVQHVCQNSATIPETNIRLMEEILHHLRLVVYPIIHTGGAGFLPSTIAPANWWLEYYLVSFADFQGRTVSFREGLSMTFYDDIYLVVGKSVHTAYPPWGENSRKNMRNTTI